MNRPAADQNSRGDVFTVPQRGGVGSEAFDNQVKTLPARCFRFKLTPSAGISVHSIVVPSSEVSRSRTCHPLSVGWSQRRIGVKWMCHQVDSATLVGEWGGFELDGELVANLVGDVGVQLDSDFQCRGMSAAKPNLLASGLPQRNSISATTSVMPSARRIPCFWRLGRYNPAPAPRRCPPRLPRTGTA